MALAQLSGHPRGPGLRWPELVGIATHGTSDPTTVAHRLLLLAPILGDTYTDTDSDAHADTGSDAVAFLAGALSLVAGADRGSPEVRSAAGLLAHRDPARWRCDDGVWVCDGVASRRNPAGHDPLSPDDLRRACAALRS